MERLFLALVYLVEIFLYVKLADLMASDGTAFVLLMVIP